MVGEATQLLPREKLIEQGARQLSDAELMAVIFGTGTSKESVFTLSERLCRYGDGFGFSSLPADIFSKEWDLPLIKVCQLQASIELGRRFFESQNEEKIILRTPEQVAEHTKDLLPLQKEVFRGLYLNCRNQLIHDEWVSVGSLSMSLVHPREVFQPAIRHSAYAVIVVHNHPSGDPAPSAEDRLLTDRLIHAAKLLGIEFLDHVIVAGGRFTSFQREGWMEKENGKWKVGNGKY